jgi:hypothetical protein
MASLGKWMKLLGIAQAAASLGLLFFVAYGSLAVITEGSPILAVVGAGVAVLLALFLRQALALLAAADHFAHTEVEPAEAHEHLVLAFQRLRPVFVIDAALAFCAIAVHIAGGLV